MFIALMMTSGAMAQTVRNSSGSSIGKAQGIPREWVAAYFFFFPFY